MSEPKMTAEERIAKHTIRVAVQYCEDEEFVEPEDAVEACKAHASEAVEPWKARVAELEAQKNGAYSERNKLVAALSKVFPAALSRHPDEDTTWDNDWRWIVFVDLPTGQASWHIHDSEKPLFDHLRHEQRVWDGHTTDQKYARLAALGKEAYRG